MQLKRVIGPITRIETIASGHGIRILARLNENFGFGRWRKLKGIATVELSNGEIHRAEIHWYEANGIGRRAFKVKKVLD